MNECEACECAGSRDSCLTAWGCRVAIEFLTYKGGNAADFFGKLL